MAEGFGRPQRRELPSTQGNPGNYNGLWDAIVADDKDPQKIGRVRVRVLDLHDDNTPVGDLPWAYPLFPSAFQSKDSSTQSGGFFHVPPVDALVNVMFKHGDPEFPVWLGGWYPKSPAMIGREAYGSNAQRVALYNDNGQPTCPTWRSLRGNIIEMDDATNEIRITSVDGHKFTMSGALGEHDDCIKMEDRKGNYIWMKTGDDLLAIYFDGNIQEYCTGDRNTIVDGDWKIKLGGDLSLHVAKNVHIKSDQSINIDALPLNLNCQLARPVDPDEPSAGSASGGDKVNGILASLGNAIKNFIVGS